MHTALLARVEEIAVLIPIVAVAGVILISTVGIIVGAIRRVAQTKAREESRREIAAYVAEGTITPDDAAKLLNAGQTISSAFADAIKNR